MITPVDRLFEAHLTASDLDASIAFYRDQVGLELAHVVPARQAAFFWVGSRGSTMLGLWAGGSAPQKTTTHMRSWPRAMMWSLRHACCSQPASRRSTSTVVRRTSRSSSRGCRRRRSTFTIPMGTCWSTSPCWLKTAPRWRGPEVA